MRKIELLQECALGNRGDVVTEDETTADILIREEIAKPAPSESLEMESDAVSRPGEEEREGVNVERLMPGGMFISADDVDPGDAAKIQEPGHVDDSFDSDRLVLPVVFQNEDRQVSLGPENIERIAREYGMNTKSWVGKAIQVTGIKEYAGINKKGIVWKAPTGGGE